MTASPLSDSHPTRLNRTGLEAEGLLDQWDGRRGRKEGARGWGYQGTGANGWWPGGSHPSSPAVLKLEPNARGPEISGISAFPFTRLHLGVPRSSGWGCPLFFFVTETKQGQPPCESQAIWSPGSLGAFKRNPFLDLRKSPKPPPTASNPQFLRDWPLPPLEKCFSCYGVTPHTHTQTHTSFEILSYHPRGVPSCQL